MIKNSGRKWQFNVADKQTVFTAGTRKEASTSRDSHHETSQGQKKAKRVSGMKAAMLWRQGTDVGIFDPYLLKVKQPSQIYKEGHTESLFLMKLKCDTIVNACIESDFLKAIFFAQTKCPANKKCT